MRSNLKFPLKIRTTWDHIIITHNLITTTTLPFGTLQKCPHLHYLEHPRYLKYPRCPKCPNHSHNPHNHLNWWVVRIHPVVLLLVWKYEIKWKSSLHKQRIIYQIISFFFQNWYNSWYYPGSHYPKAESESNSTSGSDEKALVILNIILYYFYVCIGLENGWKKMQYDISLLHSF